jgi:hypothetical protein
MLTATLVSGCGKPRAALPAVLATPVARSSTDAKAQPTDPSPDTNEAPPQPSLTERPPETDEDAASIASTCDEHQARVAAAMEASRSCESDDDCVEIHLHCFAPCKAAIRSDARVSILAAATVYFDACGMGCGKPKCAQLGAGGPVCVDGRCTMDR